MALLLPLPLLAVVAGAAVEVMPDRLLLKGEGIEVIPGAGAYAHQVVVIEVHRQGCEHVDHPAGLDAAQPGGEARVMEAPGQKRFGEGLFLVRQVVVDDDHGGLAQLAAQSDQQRQRLRTAEPVGNVFHHEQVAVEEAVAARIPVRREDALVRPPDSRCPRVLDRLALVEGRLLDGRGDPVLAGAFSAADDQVLAGFDELAGEEFFQLAAVEGTGKLEVGQGAFCLLIAHLRSFHFCLPLACLRGG